MGLAYLPYIGVVDWGSIDQQSHATGRVWVEIRGGQPLSADPRRKI